MFFKRNKVIQVWNDMSASEIVDRIVIFLWTVPLRNCFFFSVLFFYLAFLYQFFISLDLDFLFCLRLLNWICQRFRLSPWLLLSVFSVLITADTDVLIRLRDRGPWSHCYCNNYSSLPQSNNPWTPEEFSHTLMQENSHYPLWRGTLAPELGWRQGAFPGWLSILPK